MEVTQAPIPQLPKFASECRELLEKLDKGEPIWTLEMGGMGPGYEQCILADKGFPHLKAA
jgi:hypothetical protein